jgi:hypothetical protein
MDIVPKYKEKDIAKFDNLNEFMDAFVELHKQTIELICGIIDSKYCDKTGEPIVINKDEAVLAGNLMRLNKLNISFLQNICECKMQICFILNRCIAETAINLKYILIEGEDRVKRNYIKNSLITEKELWEIILSNVKERNGDILPIETRMKKSIENSFDSSDFEIDEVNHSSKWKKLKSRADIVAGEMFYSVYYGISSHSVHGNWQDILVNNLQKVDNGFKVNFDWQIPRPQIISGPIVLNLDIVNLFNDKELKDDQNHDLIKTKTESLMDYHDILLDYHEKWLNK